MKYKLIEKIYNSQQKIRYYSEKIKFVSCYYVKNYYLNLIEIENQKSIRLLNIIYNEESKKKRSLDVKKQFTLEELSKYDGANGRKAYVAIDGIIYDVSLSSVWGGGTHFGLYAGKDLTSQFKGCHMGNLKILKDLLIVGELQV